MTLVLLDYKFLDYIFLGHLLALSSAMIELRRCASSRELSPIVLAKTISIMATQATLYNVVNGCWYVRVE